MLVKIVNIVSYLICRAVVLVFVRPEIKIAPSTVAYRKKRGEGLIMICNHKFLLDSWIICASLPFKTFFSLMPVRIMGAVEFDDVVASTLNKLGIVKIIYYLYGVLGFKKGWTFEQKLAPLITCLRVSGTVLIYPEGRLVREPGVASFKQGIVRVYQAVPSDILPFAVKREASRLIVSIGAITRIPETVLQSEDPADPFPTQSCEFLRQKVAELYS